MRARLLTLAVVLAVASIATPAQEPVSTGDASGSSQSHSITGRVLASDGQPLSNVQVYVREAGRSNGMPRTAQTDTEGRFSVDELPPHAYRVWARAPAYVTPESPDPSRESYYWPGSAVTITLVKGGVITGTVTSASGEPVVAMAVSALPVRQKGKPPSGWRQQAATDDRGVYRIYGVQAGEYRVLAGAGAGGFNVTPQGIPEDEQAPTYYPSATYDAATIVRVGLGEEITGIDIQYRGLKGHAVSGSFVGAVPETGAGAFIQLNRLDGGSEASTYANFGSSPRFSMNGIPDGQYELSAGCYGSKGPSSIAKPVRVTVRGADVTGLQLTLEAVGLIEGKIVIEPLDPAKVPDGCAKPSGSTIPEAVLGWNRDEAVSETSAEVAFGASTEVAPEPSGAFEASGLRAGLYRVAPRLPGDGWYVKSVIGPRPKSGGAASDFGRDGVSLGVGRTVSGVIVTLSEGAAQVRGRVVATVEGQAVPNSARVFLVPAEPADAENVLRYFSATLDGSGGFTIRYVPPGKYRIVGRSRNDETRTRPIYWERTERTKLRAEAEAAKQEFDLGVCAQPADVVVRLK